MSHARGHDERRTSAAVNILTAEAGLFVGIIAIALWVLKVTVSTYWLTVIGEIARAIASAVIQVTTRGGSAAGRGADRGVRRRDDGETR